MINPGSYWRDSDPVFSSAIFRVLGSLDGKITIIRLNNDKHPPLVLTFDEYSFINYFEPLTPLEVELL